MLYSAWEKLFSRKYEMSGVCKVTIDELQEKGPSDVAAGGSRREIHSQE